MQWKGRLATSAEAVAPANSLHPNGAPFRTRRRGGSRCHNRGVRPVGLALFALLLLAASAVAEERALPDLPSFIAQVKSRLATDDERQSGYVFLEKRIAQRVDGAGRMTDQTVDVFEVYPGLPGEGRYRRQIEEKGKPVPADRLARRDRERQKEAEAYARRLSSAGARDKDARERAKARQELEATVDDLLQMHEVRLVGRAVLDGHDTIAMTLTPRPKARSRTDGGRFLKSFKVRAWISESDFEPVRVEVEAIDDLSVGWSLLARVHKGTVATFQRRKVNDEVWLPEQATWTASARVLLLRRLRLRGVAEYSGYRKFTVDTSTSPATPRPSAP